MAALFKVRRCWEAYCPVQQNLVIIGHPEGRLIEISSCRGDGLLMDRRVARELALEILNLAGPADEIESDRRFSGIPYVSMAGGAPELIANDPRPAITGDDFPV